MRPRRRHRQDGTGDNADTDDDGDGVADNAGAFPLDRDFRHRQDGTGNNADTDDDGDGVTDSADAFLDATETLDTDSDGTGNNAIPMMTVTVWLTVQTFPRCDGDRRYEDGTGNNADTGDDDGVADGADASRSMRQRPSIRTRTVPATTRTRTMTVMGLPTVLMPSRSMRRNRRYG